ncbi:terminase small subunit [Brevibacillus formosus]
MKLTPKQQKFADYYIETGNATEAYRRAGYTGKGNVAEAAEGKTRLAAP